MNTEKIPENNFFMLAEDPRHPERQPFSSKGDRTKDKKRDKRVWDKDPSQRGSHEGGEVSKHEETLSPAGLCGVLEFQRVA